MLASLVSSATPKAPFIPPVCARLMCGRRRLYLWVVKTVDDDLVIRPQQPKLCVDGAGGPALGPAGDPHAKQNHNQHNGGPENKPKPSHDVLAISYASP